MTIQTITTAPTTSLATAFSNQKKEATLSTGREVAVIQSTSTNAKFWWSDDNWATKTDFGADIAGWSNGSIYPYVDSGGTERLVAVWKQSGTGGSPARTDLHVYVAVGTFNAGRTTITWGTAVDFDSGTSRDFPDVVAHAESTGGRAHIARSTTGNAVVVIATIDSSGAVTGVDAGTLIGATTAHGYISLAINPTDKRIHATWSAGTTGVGSGTRYRTAAYSAGPIWTWATEVEVDNTRYISTDARFLVARWYAAGSMIVLGGLVSTSGSASNDLMQYESTNFTSFTTRTLATGLTTGAVFDGGMAIDPNTGDTYYAGRDSTQANVAYYKWTRATTTLGSRTTIETAANSRPFINMWSTTLKVGIIWTALAASPYTVRAESLTINNPPTLAIVSPADGASLVTDTPDFVCTVTDPDSGQTVTLTVEVSTTNFGSALQTLSTTQATPASAVSKTVTATALPRGVTYYWRAKVSDGISTSSWTTVRSFLVYKAGQLWPRGSW